MISNKSIICENNHCKRNYAKIFKYSEFIIKAIELCYLSGEDQ